MKYGDCNTNHPTETVAKNISYSMKKFYLAFLISSAIFLITGRPAQALTLSPPTVDTSAKPGETVRITAKLYNEGDSALIIRPTTFSFGANGEDGQPNFFEDKSGLGLQHWITVPAEFVLAPKERQTTIITVSVPLNADPGGHYAAVFWGSDSPKVEGTGTSIQGKIAMLILVNVEGRITEDAKIIEFGAKNKIVTHLPVELMARFQNNGTVHVHPAGSVAIKNIIGRKVTVLPFNIQPSTGNVLPKSIRRFDLAWYKNAIDSGASEWSKEWENFALGRYTAELTASYGVSNKTVTATTVFWVFPWMVMIVGALAITIILLGLILLVRSYNRHIIRKYAQGNAGK